MVYILLAVLGLLVIHLFDIVSLKGLRFVKPLTWAAGSGLLIWAIIMICREPARLSLPDWSLVLGWVLFVISAPLLVVSLFTNLPFYRTYVRAGVGERLVTSGLYSLVRHPGVPALTLLLAAVLLVSRARLMLAALPVLVGVDIALVYIQDRFIFGRMFAGYAEYRRRTPMLIPNRQSISDFIGSFRNEPRMPVEGGNDVRDY